MARIRTIKPEFRESETMGRVSREARLLFVLLWTVVDDAGRAQGNSRWLANTLYPYDDDARGCIEAWLQELEAEQCVRRYIVDGNSYIDIPKWLKHQKIDRPSKSRLPEFVETSRALASQSRGSDADHRSMTLDPGPRTRDQNLAVREGSEGTSHTHASTREDGPNGNGAFGPHPNPGLPLNDWDELGDADEAAA